MKAQELKNCLKSDEDVIVLGPDGLYYPIATVQVLQNNIVVLKCKDIKGENK